MKAKTKIWLKGTLAAAFIFCFAVLPAMASMFVSSSAKRIEASNFTRDMMLFELDGTLNYDVAQHILSMADATQAQRHLTANHFRMFPSHGDGNVLALSNMHFRVAHADDDSIIVWAVAPYRNSPFSLREPNADTHGGYCFSIMYWQYISDVGVVSSDLRNNLMADFNALPEQFTNNEVIIPLGGNWEARSNPSDRIWIPSWDQVNDGGQWGLTASAQRAFRNRIPTGVATNVWLRQQSNLVSMNQDGYTWHDAPVASQERGVMPAIRLSRSVLEAVEYIPDTETNSLINFAGEINQGLAAHINAMINANHTDRMLQENTFRLFPTSGSQSTRMLSQLYFRVVNATDNAVYVWATQPYRISAFNSAANIANFEHPGRYTYVFGDDEAGWTTQSSTIRTELINDFNNLPQALRTNSAILEMDGNWQIHSNPSDRIFIPSRQDVQNAYEGSGNWGFASGGHQGFRWNDVSNTVWLRSWDSANTLTNQGVLSHYQDGVVTGDGLAEQYGIMPALRLCRQELGLVALDAPVVQGISNSGVVSWQEIAGATTYQIYINGETFGSPTAALSMDISTFDFASGTHNVQVRALGTLSSHTSNQSAEYGFEITQLNPPTDLQIEDGLLTWNAVAGDLFAVYSGLQRLGTTSELEFDLNDYLKTPGTFSITVVAIQNNFFVRTSEPSQAEYFTIENDNNNNYYDDDDSNLGLIIGIVGGISALAIAGGISFWFIKKRRK